MVNMINPKDAYTPLGNGQSAIEELTQNSKCRLLRWYSRHQSAGLGVSAW